jgi:hypothetical protein
VIEYIFAVLPILLTQALHANRSVVGVVEGVAEATQNVVQGFSGGSRISSRKGKL